MRQPETDSHAVFNGAFRLLQQDFCLAPQECGGIGPRNRNDAEETFEPARAEKHLTVDGVHPEFWNTPATSQHPGLGSAAHEVPPVGQAHAKPDNELAWIFRRGAQPAASVPSVGLAKCPVSNRPAARRTALSSSRERACHGLFSCMANAFAAWTK